MLPCISVLLFPIKEAIIQLRTVRALPSMASDPLVS
jgi:hypothetical protein